jgi:hypothetical protein
MRCGMRCGEPIEILEGLLESGKSSSRLLGLSHGQICGQLADGRPVIPLLLPPTVNIVQTHRDGAIIISIIVCMQ